MTWRRNPRTATHVLVALARALRFTLAGVLGTAFLATCVSTGQRVLAPWRAGNATSFQTGTVEERRAQAVQGWLPITLSRPTGAGPFPFVVLLHGCGGLKHEAFWTQWVRPWATLFHTHGIGTAVVDSFGPRGVDHVCTGDVAAWAVRRTDDAYSTRAWLAAQPDVDAQHTAVMGMSNGGRTVLAALRTTWQHPERFVAGVALYPGCQTDVSSTFYAPLLVLMGRADTVTPAHFCEQMHAAQPASAPELRLVIYPHGPHTFDMRLPDRTVLGMHLGYDPQAEADARRQVMDFFAAHGLAALHTGQ
jgi:dienelactone hydrolase